MHIADSLRDSGGSRVESATLTFSTAGHTHKPLTVHAARNTAEVPYLAYEEWDTDAVQHPQGFDVQIGGHADADCPVDFGGQPQRN